MWAWQYEMERIVNRIPLEGLTRDDIDFAIDLTIVARPAKTISILLPLENLDVSGGAQSFLRPIKAGMKAPKSMVGSLKAEEWEGMSESEIKARRTELWTSLHLAQHGMSQWLAKVYYSLSRVKDGKSRHPAAAGDRKRSGYRVYN